MSFFCESVSLCRLFLIMFYDYFLSTSGRKAKGIRDNFYPNRLDSPGPTRRIKSDLMITDGEKARGESQGQGL